MLELFRFLVDYQIWIYAILGVLALIYLIKLIKAWRERYTTIFGLEREDAQRRLNSALAIFVLLILLIGAEFVLVTFVIPEWPLVMITPTPTQSAEEEIPIQNPYASDSGLVVVSTPEGSAPAEQQQTSVVSVLSSGCVANQLEWLAPVSGDVIEGSYTLEATVNVQDMAFYNWAFSPVGDQMNWQTLSAGNLPVIEGPLGLWATTQVANGDYVLRLTVYDLNNEQLPPCDVYIRVLNEE
ncbi:MAG: hypothetical protein II969_12820 [Anaerolineaceae bacterium]|nr:hypothetical protein [Anaerolineaceae bacterium]